jgi:2-desacetyl-2-hydroxyethyl bacteriochlorophyllide A dehydrogenase
MKAVVIERPGAIKVEDVDDPMPSGDQVVVEVEACGICGTDVHILDGEFAPTPYPIVPGHEFCGEVVAVGSDVGGRREGDLVAVDPSLFCGECAFCQQGRGNLCERWNAIGVTTAGACADLVAVPAASTFGLPDDIPRAWGTLVEPLSCAVHGFDRIPARLGDDYLIYGAGTMGLLLAQLARRAGAHEISVVDSNAARLPTATKLGVDRTATSAAELDRPQGWNIVIDATGAIPAIEDGLTRVTKGGSFLVFGVAPADATATFSPFRIYNEEINVIGSMAVLHSFERARDLLASGAIDCETMITHRLALDNYEEAIRSFRSGAGLKIQVSPKAP